MRIVSLVPGGSGALVLHRQLARNIKGYAVREYSPRWELFPPALRFFNRERADLVHAASDFAGFARRRGVPLVVTLHGYNIDRDFRPFATPVQRVHYATLLRWSLRYALASADAIVAVSEATAGLARRDLGVQRPMTVIPNGVNLQQFVPGNGTRSETVRVLFSGNLSRRKGAHLLPGIADLLDPGVQLVCTSGLRRNQAPFRHPRIEWLGSIAPEEMPAVYRSADMLLAPSFREGLSLAVLEAMASGLPVIASDTSSFPEQVHEGKGGYLCEPGNVSAFAAKINALAAAPSARLEMGQYNRARAEADYDERRMARQYEALFSSVVRQR